VSYHVKCGRAACTFHVRAASEVTADEVAAGHEERTDHSVSVIPDGLVEFERASERVDDPAGDDEHVEAT
jgi:hypothetical protein